MGWSYFSSILGENVHSFQGKKIQAATKKGYGARTINYDINSPGQMHTVTFSTIALCSPLETDLQTPQSTCKCVFKIHVNKASKQLPVLKCKKLMTQSKKNNHVLHFSTEYWRQKCWLMSKYPGLSFWGTHFSHSDVLIWVHSGMCWTITNNIDKSSWGLTSDPPAPNPNKGDLMPSECFCACCSNGVAEGISGSLPGRCSLSAGYHTALVRKRTVVLIDLVSGVQPHEPMRVTASQKTLTQTVHIRKK